MSLIGGSMRTIRPGEAPMTGARTGDTNSNINDTVMVRSLRRQLYEALSRNDAKRAMEVFLMTRTQYLEQFHPINNNNNSKNPPPSAPSSTRKVAVLDKTPILAEIMNPLDPFQSDDAKAHTDKYNDYGENIITQQQQQSGSMSRIFRRKPHHRTTTSAIEMEDSFVAILEDSATITTPLHQAARLGSLDLFKVFLARVPVDQDLDVRDGQGRTVLHCLTGMVGELPIVASPVSTKESKRWGLFHRRSRRSEESTLASTTFDPPKSLIDQQDERVAMSLLLLSSHQISANAVDKSMGRTALHYAALHNWATLCDVLLQTSAFDTTMLTVVDADGRTPAELASDTRLSASLEAKCLLAVDPYGTMTDQFANTLTLHQNNDVDNLANPFGWFESNNIRRKARIQQALVKIQGLTKGILTQNIKLIDSDTNETEADIVEHSLIERVHVHPDADDPPGAEATLVGSAVPNSHLLTHLHENHVEKLLEYHKWNVKDAIQKFFANPFETLSLAGIDLKGYDNDSLLPNQTCQICYEDDVEDDDWKLLEGCKHGFCKGCLKAYIEDCASSKQSAITCPHHDCKALLSPCELSSLGPSERLEAIADEHFVMSCPEYRYCPEPGCGCPVRINLNSLPGPRDSIQDVQAIVKLVGGVCTFNPDAPLESPLTYEGVPDPNYHSLTKAPRRAHRFCFVCGDRKVHWPVDCKKLQEWKDVIRLHVGEAGGGDAETNHDDIAQTLWMKTNTRPCPKCDAPIQKNEGCNHMTCLNPHCKYEFCWICRNDWKKHSTATGGFYRCNRWAEENEHQFYDGAEHNRGDALVSTLEDLADPRTLEATYGTAMHESRTTRDKSSKMDRFIHHYQRWSAHRDSAALEQKMWEEAVTRLAPVVDEMLAFTESDHLFGGKGLCFIHAAFTELLESRSMLQHSYAFSYHRYMFETRQGFGMLGWKRREKSDFERSQSELELLTEQISDVVARKHIRATQEQIVYLTKATAQKRNEFSNTMMLCLRAERQEEEEIKQPSHRSNNTLGTTESAARVLLRQSLGDLLAENGLERLLEYDSEQEIEDWMCPACTFVNTGRRRCEMCSGYRPR